MSLGKKLFLIVFANILISVLIAAVAFWNIEILGEEIGVATMTSKALRNHMQGDMMHDALRGDVLRALYASNSKESTVGTKEEVEADLKEHITTFRENIAANQALELSPKVRAELADSLPALDAYIKAASSIVDAAFLDYSTGLAELPNFLKAFSELEEKLELLGNDIEKEVEASESQDLAHINFAKVLFGVLLGVAFLLGSVLVVVLDRSVTKVLGKLIVSLREASGQLNASADQVAASAQSLAQGASEQAASLEETAATVEEISSVAKQNAANAEHANGLSMEVNKSSETGVSSMREMSTAIESIKGSADETANIIKTIDEIAFQTNLLALNAAVEAARAGDAGKGFAVVAEEVRNLAQRSAAAAKDTTEKIRRSKELAENGVGVSKKAEKSLVEIRESSLKALDIVKEITAASKEQSTGLGQLNLAMSELDKVTQSNAAGAEESAAAGTELNIQACELEKVINSLSELVYGVRTKTTSMKFESKDPIPAKLTQSAKNSNAAKSTSKNWPTKAPLKPEGDGKVINLKPSQIIPLDDQDFQGF